MSYTETKKFTEGRTAGRMDGRTPRGITYYNRFSNGRIKMGGKKRSLNSLARDVWCWCEERNIWLSVFHIAGSLNIRTDALSRAGKKLNDDMEWALNLWVFDCIQRKMRICHIDLFASSKNFKLIYVSYLLDKGAFAVPGKRIFIILE